MSQPAISTQALTRSFRQTTAVDHLTIEVQPGEIFGFLGHNGAGKTTTVRLLNGILKADAGTARVLGLDPQADGPQLRASTGVLTENPSLDTRLSGRENLAYFTRLYGIADGPGRERVAALLEEFDLAVQADDRVSTYSRGMQQRLALARALVHHPRLLFLDEPTSGLDPVAAHHVNQLIEHLSRSEGCTVFLCTHNLVDAQRLCHRVAVLERGTVRALGTPAELTRRYVRRLAVEIDLDPAQRDRAQSLLAGAARLVSGIQSLNAQTLVLTALGLDAVPEILKLLVEAGIPVYRLAPQEVNLEEVYFALNRREA